MATITLYPKNLRIRWYRLVDADKRSVADVCKTFGIPRKTYYKWRRRDLGRSDPNRQNWKRQPALKLTPKLCIAISQEKHRTNYGPRKMALWVKREYKIAVSPTIIYRFYRRKGLIQQPQRRLPWYRPLKHRIIPQGPGELVEADLKYGWFDGVRQYQFTFYDVFTGWPMVTMRLRKTDDDAIVAFKEARKRFPFTVKLVQTDNGGEWRGDFHRYLQQLNIGHVFIPKSSPWWSGHVERFHGVIDKELWLNFRHRFSTLEEYLTYYRTDRIHLGKYHNGLTPLQKLREYQKCHP